MIRASVVLFDVMGTLVHDPFFDEVPRFFGMTLDELLAVKHPTTWLEFERGEIDDEILGSRFFSDHRNFDLAGLERTMKNAYRLLDGIEPLLDELASRGVEMHAFSNYPTWYRLIEDAVGLSRWLQWSFVSCLTGVRKPAEAAYRVVVQQLDRPATEMLFVDDREVNCDAGRQVGMQVIRFTDSSALRRQLSSMGLVSPRTTASRSGG